MSRGRHGDKKGTKKGKPREGVIEVVSSSSYIEKLSFEVLAEGKEEESSTCFSSSPLLLTLLFDTKQAQHEALSRIEAFYEAAGQDEQKRYLTLEEAQNQKICRHYEAFNFPLSVVGKWLQLMQERFDALSQQDPKGKLAVEEEKGKTQLSIAPGNDNQDIETVETSRFWEKHCTPQECHLLNLLESLGVIDSKGAFLPTPEAQSSSSSPASLSNDSSATPTYLISTFKSKRASLRHERLHFLFYISSEYRQKVQEEYESLSSKALKIIQYDLNMRKYSAQVWMDEFQAYISEDASEFGKSIQQECQVIQQSLISFQHTIRRDNKLLLNLR